jgi:hypothetical protein
MLDRPDSERGDKDRAELVKLLKEPARRPPPTS